MRGEFPRSHTALQFCNRNFVKFESGGDGCVGRSCNLFRRRYLCGSEGDASHNSALHKLSTIHDEPRRWNNGSTPLLIRSAVKSQCNLFEGVRLAARLVLRAKEGKKTATSAEA